MEARLRWQYGDDNNLTLLNKRHGYHLTCQTCKSKSRDGGFENPKQFSKILQEQRRNHRNHDYQIKQSYHAAELTHTFKEKTSRVTTTGTTYANVDTTNAAIPSSFFTSGKKYYIEVVAHLDDDNTGNSSGARMIHGSTAFADSEWSFEPNIVNPAFMVYNWWVVWTAVSGEGINLQFNNSGAANTGIDQVFLVCFKLSDDLNEDTGSGGDWKTNEVTANTSLTAGSGDSASNNAAITFTPATANDIWLIKSKSRWTNAAIASQGGSRIVRSGQASSTSPFAQLTAEDIATDKYQMSLAMTVSLGNASNTFTEKSFSVAGGNTTRTHSGIFALNLSKLRNLAQSYSDSSVTAITAVQTNIATSPQQIASVSITPDVTGDVWCQTFMTYDCNAVARVLRYRMQVDNTDEPGTQTSDNNALADLWAATDEGPVIVQSMESLSSGSAHTVDFDAVVSSTTSTPGIRVKLAFAVTMELPAAGGGAALKFVESEPLSLSEAPLFTAAHKAVISEPASLSEGQIFAAARRMQIAEAATLAEQFISAAARKVVLNDGGLNLSEVFTTKATRKVLFPSDNINIQEQAFAYIRGRLMLVSENLTMTEATVMTKAILMMVQEQMSLQEQFRTVSNRSAVFSELASLIETSLYKSERKAVVSEPLSLTETSIFTAAKRLLQSEPISIAETSDFKANRKMLQSEAASLSESAAFKADRKFLQSESVSFDELAAFKAARKMVLQELVNLSEIIITAASKFMVINETATLHDFLEDAIIFRSDRKFLENENLPITENLILILGAIAGESLKFVSNDNMSLSENIAFRKDIKMAIQDGNLDLLEDLIHIGHRKAVWDEQIMLSEHLDTIKAIKVVLADENIVMTEAFPYIRGLVMVVSEIMEMSESLLSTRGKVMIVEEALDIVEDLIIKLEEGVGPPPGVFGPIFFFAPQRKRFRLKQVQKPRLQKQPKAPELKIPKLPIIITREWGFVFNVPAPAPTPQAIADLLTYNSVLESVRQPKIIEPEFVVKRHRVEREYGFSFQVRQLVEREWSIGFSVYNLVERALAMTFGVRTVDWEELEFLQETKNLLLRASAIAMVTEDGDGGGT